MKYLAVRLPLLLCLLSAVPLFAQTADVSGVVMDPSGAAVAGAKVRLVNQATLVERNVTTNAQGNFVVPFMPPGVYEVFVDASGFSTEVIRDIKIDVAAKINLPVRLEVGRQTQTVRVDGSGLILNTVDASVSTVIDQNFVENMPLNGRSFQDLISMTPDVVTQSPQASAGYSAVGSSGDFSVNGQRTESNYYMVDGVAGNIASGNGSGGPQAGTSGSVAASTVLGTTQSLISVDALQEFRVESSTYSAEYGRSPGGQFSFATRSGTNAAHGTAFDYLRNNFFDANDWFNDHYGEPISALRQNDFGGTFGGPIFIPKLYDGRDKSFFFASYEGLRLMLPQAASLEYVPSLTLRQSAPAALQPILNSYPAPTGAEVQLNGSPTGMSPFTLPYSSPSQIDSISVRFDQMLSAKARLFFRFADNPSSTTTRLLSAVTQSEINNQTYTLGATYQISGRMTDEFRLGYDRANSSQVGSIDNFGGASPTNLAQDVGIGGYGNAFPGFFFFVPGVGSSELSLGDTANRGLQWNVINTLSLLKGDHQFRLGVDYRRIRSPLTPPSPYVVGLYEGEQEVLSNQALDVDVDKTDPATPIFNELAAFLQDQWHVAPGLSAALGIRWEVDPAPSEANGESAYTVLGNLQNPSSLYLAPRGTALWKTPWTNFAPRLGIAWTVHDTPGRQTVVRTGGGAFFDTDNEEATLGFQDLGFGAYQLYFGIPLPITPSQVDFPISVTPPYSAAVVAFPQHLQLPYTLQWNVSLEQALGMSQALTISYVGSNGRRLPQNQILSVSALNPNFGTIEYIPGNVTSNYQALQLKFQRSVSHGIHALASYTWSHSLDYGSNDSAQPLTRGNSDFDVRNNFQSGITWDLPIAKTRQSIQELWTNWGLDGRLIVRSAFPITLSGNYLTDPTTGLGYYGNVDLAPSQPIYLYGSQYPGGRAVNPAAFELPSGASDPGNAPRNFVRGFGEGQLNLAARRDFPITEGIHLQFRAETFNLLNHPNFGYVDPNLTDAAFGQATMMLNSSLGTVASQYQQGGPRSMQFALKITF